MRVEWQPDVTAASDSVMNYIVILFEHGIGSSEAEEYFSAHRDDQTFERRARAAELAYRNRDKLLEELRRLDVIEGFPQANSQLGKGPITS